jgi:hypothetical protein
MGSMNQNGDDAKFPKAKNFLLSLVAVMASQLAYCGRTLRGCIQEWPNTSDQFVKYATSICEISGSHGDEDRVFGPKRYRVTEKGRKLHNEEFHNSYSSNEKG